jgi:hypothetical protein
MILSVFSISVKYPSLILYYSEEGAAAAFFCITYRGKLLQHKLIRVQRTNKSTRVPVSPVHGKLVAKVPAKSSNFPQFPRLGGRGNSRVPGLCPNLVYNIFAILVIPVPRGTDVECALLHACAAHISVLVHTKFSACVMPTYRTYPVLRVLICNVLKY